MRLALRELRRRPGRFAAAIAMLTLLVVLLLLLGGLLDGLYRGSTGALRAQDGELVVFSSEARDSVLRSRIPPELRTQVAAAPGVATTRGLGVALVGAQVPGESGYADAAVWGYQGGVQGVPAPPPVGEAWVDRRLEQDGVRVGQVLRLGPGRVPVKVKGMVSDTSYLLQGGVWVAPPTWREVVRTARPDAVLAPGTFQVLSVAVTDGANAKTVAKAIDRATDGATTTRTVDEAILAIPGVESQQSTFSGIIYVTLLVAGLVVALFFALVTLERTALYGVLKAIGASSRQLLTGVFTQAIVTATLAFVLGALIARLIDAVAPPAIPLQLLPQRAVSTLVGVLVAALLGSAVSLRRVVRIDPATAIGGGA